MQTYEVYRNRAFVGTVKAVSIRQACQTARRRYGRVEVIGNATRGDTHAGPDSHRTEGRAPCNRSEEARAKIEAIRSAAIAEFLHAKGN